MRKREIAALFATVAFFWPAGRCVFFVPPGTATPSPIGLQLAQNGRVGRGYAIQSFVGGSGGGRAMMADRPACSGKLAGEPCSFASPDGQTVDGTCTTIGDQLACVWAGTIGGSASGQPEPQPDGAR